MLDTEGNKWDVTSTPVLATRSQALTMMRDRMMTKMGDPGPDDSDPPEEDGEDHKHCPDTHKGVSGQCQISYTVLTASACVRTAK